MEQTTLSKSAEMAERFAASVVLNHLFIFQIKKLNTSLSDNCFEKFKGNKSKLTKNSISIGNELSFSLNIKIGDEITLMSPTGVETIIGNMPKQKTFIITSIFNSGLADFDNNIAIINLDTLDEFFSYEKKNRKEMLCVCVLELLCPDTVPPHAPPLRRPLQVL